ncbi:molecular chaperone HtpG [Lutispora thermophila]|uniref:Molecular chaperone HtpG n=1 Tax=Lutispora thermophila DSM 19022 TaxID=1122184 RepID=A0A1M6DKM9_9FIRM|nr:molecular chaperone HtpG [Lutispora thermophila]SHI73816.1 molecular chaperone HtpG [Lutispora thermophila DSM 19022]
MNRESGSISIQTENIFPIIKKWLYSDKDIFVRELISNGVDAINKLKRLASIGEAEISSEEKFEVKVSFNKDEKTIKFIDNGIGMTAEEVKKYINQVAFSGAKEFIEKYKDKMGEEAEIIGHFGLGFYSAFMVSKKVEVDTLSYQSGAEAVKWISEGGTEYELTSSERASRGTTVTLYIDEESEEFLDEYKLRGIIQKHCAFLPVKIYLEDEKFKKEGEDRKPLNDINPLWLKNPKDCTEEEYKAFYRKVFNDFNDPLFWIHLSVDYPFNLKGILYFPKLRHEYEISEGQIKLYNNQVFVADNIKEIIPEFLMLLKGTIDCADLPLNVSRSFLQKDSNVIKLSKHITKKVADKLTELFEKEREKYEGFWKDISPFIKYGSIKDRNFYDKIKDVLIFKSINGNYLTLNEYFEKTGGKKEGDKEENKIFYASDEKKQHQYIKLFKDQGLEAVVLDSVIDNHFISYLEMYELNVKFYRIDSDLADSLKDIETEGKEDKAKEEKLVEEVKKALNIEKLEVKLERLKNDETQAVLLMAEHERRLQEMSAMFGAEEMNKMFKGEETLILNKSNNLVKALGSLMDKEEKKEDFQMICSHIYDLALMGSRGLDGDKLEAFLKRSGMILERLANI